MAATHYRLYIEEHDFVRPVAIDTLGAGTTKLTLTGQRAMDLYGSGHSASSWTRDAKGCRTGKPRRENLPPRTSHTHERCGSCRAGPAILLPTDRAYIIQRGRTRVRRSLVGGVRGVAAESRRRISVEIGSGR
jgi:hypothetical protein